MKPSATKPAPRPGPLAARRIQDERRRHLCPLFVRFAAGGFAPPVGRTAARVKGVQAFISRGTEGLQTRRWRKADSNGWSRLRLNRSDTGERDEQIAISPLHRIDDQSLERLVIAHTFQRVRIPALCSPGEAD